MSQTSFDKDKIRILLLEGVHASAIERFHAAGYENIERRAGALQGDELAHALADVHIVGIRSRTQLTAAALAEARRLIAVGCFCIGTNQVALKDAMLRGVPVFNAPFSNTRSVAELVLAEAVLLLRGIPEKHGLLKQGVWQKSAAASFEIRGKTLGVIGYGNIGSQLGVMAEALGMHVQFYDAVKRLNLGNARQLDSLDELLTSSDVVTLHVPDLPTTRNMIGAREIALMKKTGVLINASRGNVVDLDALAASLQANHLLGAAIDVYPEEPKSNDDPFVSPLLACDNVILTPHIGGSTAEAQENIGSEVADKLIRYSDNGSTLSAVNFPEVALPPHPSSHRLLHIHRNVPGVLSHINRVFGEGSINIAAQYLQTNAEIGYVVIDVEAEHSQLALEKLRAVDGTIRTRVLF
ncbi:MAG TPA: phosphoglycerate dehydrogenase [Pseudomonadales bacterium]|jgi:D-3-phosphoglycerate dehydrogenase|nr:phosphoglycerate dehydrogenase [Pseudomonadales bacterium]